MKRLIFPTRNREKYIRQAYATACFTTLFTVSFTRFLTARLLPIRILADTAKEHIKR